MRTELSVPISDDPILGLPRLAHLNAFTIQGNLNILIDLHTSCRTPEGGSKLEAINNDPSLSEYQKKVARDQFADRFVSRQTQGSFVDPATGNLVPEGTEGAILQRDYFQRITLADLKTLGMTITDSTTLAELIFAMITIEIQKSDQRKEI